MSVAAASACSEFLRVYLRFNYIFPPPRRVSDLLGAIFHVQYHGCSLYEAQLRLPTWRDRIHSDNLARVGVVLMIMILSNATREDVEQEKALNLCLFLIHARTHIISCEIKFAFAIH